MTAPRTVLALAVASAALPARAKVHEVPMLNRGEQGAMVWSSPGFVDGYGVVGVSRSVALPSNAMGDL